jgi:predicted ATPase
MQGRQRFQASAGPSVLVVFIQAGSWPRKLSMALDRQFVIEVKLRREEVPSFDEYPFALPAIQALQELRLHPSVTFFVGENGSGKSTLLEAIAVACGFNPEGGSNNFNFATQASHSSLHSYLRIIRGHRRPRTGWFLRAESFYNVASDIDRLDSEPGRGPRLINAYGGVSLHKQSHGESFIALLTHRFSPSGLYLLDEPEAALSPARQLAALVRIHDLVKGGAQFVIATHSPILMSYPNAQILRFDSDGITPVDYTDTEHFLITRDFLADHRRALRRLLDDGDDRSGS